ncbi:MAG: 2,3-bisphosphoglycerate-independent phosphoglycerate mutase [bacterium]|nr:2,3-bisphosphoglycerate-independent phosphoglycerate mutase [bacterium]
MKKILMIILSGFGINDNTNGNAVKNANMEYFNYLWDNYPHSTLEASGKAVGLPEGISGNSQIGHYTISTGKKTKQKYTILEEILDSKELVNLDSFKQMINNLGDHTLHLIGLVSDASIHSNINCMIKFINILKEQGIKNVVFHAVTDGVDTGNRTSIKYLNQIDQALKDTKIGILGSISGRYYLEGQENKPERTRKYYDLIINGIGFNILNYETAIKNLYSKNITDEFFPPMLLNGKNTIKEGDTLLSLDFDIINKAFLKSLCEENYSSFITKKFDNLNIYTLFPNQDLKNISSLLPYNQEEVYSLGEYFKDLKLTQARIAESNKYNEVTYYFNAEKCTKYPLTTNYLLPSPNVASYSDTPLMSAIDITKQTKKCLDQDFDFILVNYANPDALGHTGNFSATINSLEAIDKILKNLIECASDNFYNIIITSDHGNCESMVDDNNNPMFNNTNNPVPFIILDKKITLKDRGDLTNIAPTLLKYMDIKIPETMKNTKNLILEDM